MLSLGLLSHLLDRCKDPDFIESILLLFLSEFAHFDLIGEGESQSE